MVSARKAEAGVDVITSEALYQGVEQHEAKYGLNHRAGSMLRSDLEKIFAVIGTSFDCSMETGCGKSTIFFSQYAKRHLAFCLDDRADAESSVSYFQNCAVANPAAVEFVYGPTQKTLPHHDFTGCSFDLIFLDGPHAYPFPDLEYFFVYPFLRTGGFLVVDDVQIPSVGRMCDILAEDRMYDCVALVQRKTAILRRTDAPTLDPYGDNWGRQAYNMRRARASIRVDDGKKRPSFLELAG